MAHETKTVITRRSFLKAASLAAALPVRSEADDYRWAQTKAYERPRIWPSLPPADCPFGPSKDIRGVAFTGRWANYTQADTYYPSWASDGNLYTPWTDGRLFPPWRAPRIGPDGCASGTGADAHTGSAKIIGDDPFHLEFVSLGTVPGPATPYAGRYPCGSLVHNGVWYYGTYCLSPAGTAVLEDGRAYNWPWLGPFVGFRISKDYGRTWTDTRHTPAEPLFGENGMYGRPVKIGSPHFVDFGKNMEHSPDGLAYLVAHGATAPDAKPRFANNSWISGDQIFLLRVKPTPDSVNDAGQYEFYAGADSRGNPIWTRDFAAIRPLIDWNNNCGCVTVTYNAPLKKYLMCVTDGWPTVETMNTYILESDLITGPWRLVSYLRNFGVQAYFVNFISKFISHDGRTAMLCYSGNFSSHFKGKPELNDPSHTGVSHAMTLQEVKLMDDAMLEWQRAGRRAE